MIEEIPADEERTDGGACLLRCFPLAQPFSSGALWLGGRLTAEQLARRASLLLAALRFYSAILCCLTSSHDCGVKSVSAQPLNVLWSLKRWCAQHSSKSALPFFAAFVVFRSFLFLLFSVPDLRSVRVLPINGNALTAQSVAQRGAF